jgi:predicted amidohydrolase YtcJ
LTAITLRGEAAEVALGEAQAVLAMVQDDERRGRLADLVAAVQEGELGEDEAQALEELIELGLTTGRIRGLYGPEGEQAALKTYRRLPRGRELSSSAREVTEALAALEGKVLEQVSVQSAGPGAFVVSLGVEGLELSVKLDHSGARIHSVGV